MLYLICLDMPRSTGADERIAGWIRQSYDNRARPMPGVWLVDGALAAEQIHTALRPLLGPSDRLLIVKGATEAIWHGLDEVHARWMATNFPGSLTERIPGKSEGLAS